MGARPPAVHLWKRPDSPYWWVRYAWDGSEVRKSLGTPDKAVAQKRARILEAQLAAQFLGFPAGADQEGPQPVLLSDVFREYREALRPEKRRSGERNEAEQNRRMDALLRLLGNLEVRTLTTGRVQAFIDSRVAGGLSPATVRGEVAAIRAACRVAKDAGVGDGVPWEGRLRFPRAPSRRRRVIPPADFARILGGLDPALAVDRHIALLAFTGLRRSDVAGWTWEKVDLEGGWYGAGEGTQKTDRDLRTPLHPWLVEFLKRVPPGERAGKVAWVRPDSGGVHRRVRAILHPGAAYPRQKAGEPRKALPPTWGPHDFRRTFQRLLGAAGVDRRVRADLAGHEDPRTTDSYYYLSPDELLRRAVESIQVEIPSVARTPGRKRKRGGRPVLIRNQ